MLEQWQIDIINSKIRKPVYSLEWLTADEQVIDEAIIDVISGNVNFDASGNSNNRRSGSLTIKNLNKEYIPSSSSKLWISNRVRLRAGLQYNGDKKLWFNQGIYLIGNPNLLSNSVNKEITIQLHDKWCLINGTISGTLTSKYEIPVGTRIDSVIKSIVTSLMYEQKYMIDVCDVLTPYTLTIEAGRTISDILIELSNMVSYECFYNPEGYFIFRKALQPEDYEQTPSVWEFKPEGLYIESNRTLDWDQIRNSVTVYGMYNSDTGEQYIGTAKDETDSDFSVTAIGERTYYLSDDNIYNNDLAQQRANYELKNKIMLQENVTISIIPNFSLLEGDIISITDENNGCFGNYLIQQISYDMSFNPTMQITAWRIRKYK